MNGIDRKSKPNINPADRGSVNMDELEALAKAMLNTPETRVPPEGKRKPTKAEAKQPWVLRRRK